MGDKDTNGHVTASHALSISVTLKGVRSMCFQQPSTSRMGSPRLYRPHGPCCVYRLHRPVLPVPPMPHVLLYRCTLCS